MEKLKSLVEALEILLRYPIWLKVALGAWLLTGVGLLAAMVKLYPKEEGAVRLIKVSRLPAPPAGIVLEFRLENSSDQQASIVAVKLSFYERRPVPGEGGLQTTETVSGKYLVTGDAGAGSLQAMLRNDQEGLPVSIKFPLKGRPDFAIVTLDLVQKVEAKGTDRFQVALAAVGLPPQGARFVEAEVYYGEDKVTKAKEIPLN